MVEANAVGRSVLLLGEGNFSYALARLRQHVTRMTAAPKGSEKLTMVATSFDSEADLFKKYPESKQILQKMRQLRKKQSNLIDLAIAHQIDATRIRETI